MSDQESRDLATPAESVAIDLRRADLADIHQPATTVRDLLAGVSPDQTDTRL